MLIITVIAKLMIGSGKDLAWSPICYNEKEMLGWRAWLCLPMWRLSCHSPPVTSQAQPLVSLTVSALILPLHNYWYLGSSLRLDKRTGVNIHGVVGLAQGLAFLNLFHCFLHREGRQHWVDGLVRVGSTWPRSARSILGSLSVPTPLGLCCTDVSGKCRGRVGAKRLLNDAKPVICSIIIFFIRTREKTEAWGG